jgi:hypothetical protein
LVVNDIVQRTLLKMRVLGRYLVLRRQLAEMRRQLDALSSADQRAVIAHVTREMQISQRQARDAESTNVAFARARTGNPRVRVIGLAQWLTSAFRETEQSPHGELQDLHRQLMRTLRMLRESTGYATSAA